MLFYCLFRFLDRTLHCKHFTKQMKIIKRIDWTRTLLSMKVGEVVELSERDYPEASIRSAIFRLRMQGYGFDCSHKYQEPIIITRRS